MANYEITTVDWKPEQTKRWLSYVEKNCPTANITLVKDTKPVPWSWSAGKLNCFNRIYDTPDRIIYMDTDTIVLEDLEFLFDAMTGNIAASLFSTNLTHNSHMGLSGDQVRMLHTKTQTAQGTYKHWNTGMVVLNGYDPFRLHENWKLAFTFPEVADNRWQQHEETAFSIAVIMDPDIKMVEIPYEVHGNILKKKFFGDVELSKVIHYHRDKRLKDFGLGRFLEHG